MKKILTTLLTFSVLTIGSAASAATCPAEGFIQNAGAAFMGAARSGSAGAFTGAAARYADLNSIAMFALGPYRKNLPKGREGEYVALSKKFMGQFMAQYASRFSGSSIKITSCNGNVIGTKLSSGQSLTFRLHGGRRIADVSVSGIWLAQTMRSRFTGVIKSHGGDVGALMSWLGG
jgi:phospholipid transport system substrate-binding protein